jgi:periplasmic divalent cation tolerance protein
MNNSKYILGYVSFNSVEVARTLAKKLVTEKLVACAKLINNVESFYIFDGQYNEDKEVYLLMKTKEDKIEGIKDFLNIEHPYKVYEFLFQEIKIGNDKYAEWVDSILD